MSIHSLPADALARNAERLIDGSTGSADVMQLVGPYGYPPERFEAGGALLDAFRREIRQQREALGEQEALTTQLQAARRDVHRRVYMPVYFAAQRAFEDDPDARERLALDENRAEAFDPWLEQARAFFEALLAGTPSGGEETESGSEGTTTDGSAAPLHEALPGFTAQRLQDAQADVEAVADLDAQQEAAKTDRAQESAERAEAREVLLDWMVGYREMARYALADDPELQQQIGL